jgi:hypothetical protein
MRPSQKKDDIPKEKPFNMEDPLKIIQDLAKCPPWKHFPKTKHLAKHF